MITLSHPNARLVTLADGVRTYEITEDKKWIGVDFDGTLVEFDGWRGVEHIGAPLLPMIQKVQELLEGGRQVRIFTARVDDGIRQISIWKERLLGDQATPEILEKIALDFTARNVIREWTREHFGRQLEATNTKDCFCIGIYDDIAIQMVPNTGLTLADQHQAEYLADKGGKPAA